MVIITLLLTDTLLDNYVGTVLKVSPMVLVGTTSKVVVGTVT